MSEKRTRLNNGDKLAILEAIRTPGFKREDIMKQYNISQSAFYNIVQQKDKLYQDMSSDRTSKSSKAISSQQKELKSRIIRWLSEKERKGMLVGGTQIKAQALKFANEMKIEDLRLKFSDSDDQVFHF